jgi:hypothetical protein
VGMRVLGKLSRGLPSSFYFFASSAATSQLGSAMSLVALPLIVYQTTGSASRTAVLSVIEVIPYLILGIPAGTVADRSPGLLLPIVTDLVSAVAYGLLAAGLVVGRVSIGEIYAVALVGSVSFVFHDAPLARLTRDLVGIEGVPQANQIMQLANSVTSVIGPGAVALALAVAPISSVIAFDALTYIFSIVLVLPTRAPMLTPNQSVETSKWLDGLRAGVEFLWKQRALRYLTLSTAGMVITGGAFLALLTPYANLALRVSSHSSIIPLLYAAGSIGSVFSVIGIAVLRRRYTNSQISLLALAANAVLYPILVLSRTWWAALLLICLWEGTYTMVIVNNIIIRQVVTPTEMLGRISTTARMVAWGGQPLGAAAGAILVTALTIRPALLCCGVGVVCAVCFVLSGRGSISGVDAIASRRVVTRADHG